MRKKERKELEEKNARKNVQIVVGNGQGNGKQNENVMEITESQQDAASSCWRISDLQY